MAHVHVNPSTNVTPHAPFSLMLDDALVATGTLDSAGATTDFFTLAGDLAFEFYFLTASDDQGLFAASGVDLSREIFEDGFETGDTAEWTSTN